MTSAYGSVPASSGPTGKQLLRAVWQLLREDRDLLWLPVLATASGLVALLVFFGGGYGVGWAAGGNDAGVVLGLVLGSFASTTIALYFQAALVIGANQRAEGNDPSLRGVLGAAWDIRGRILRWAVVATTVGLVVRQVEQRLGVVGKLLGFLGGVAWAIATFLVVPVLVAEDLGPVEAVKRSSAVLQRTWGTSVRSSLRFGLVQFAVVIPAVVLLVVGVGLVSTGTPVAGAFGILLVIVAMLAILATGMLASAVTGYARALIYRYATGQVVPGIEPALLEGAFTQRGRRRRFA